MHPIAFLALLTIGLLALAALQLELNFRRTAGSQPNPGPGAAEPAGRQPQRPAARPELRAPPAGGYWQAPYSRAA
jgi:hypothetical protein